MFNKKLKLEIIELEERILQLEKRLEKYRKDRNDEMINIYDNICLNNDDIKELLKRIEKLERKNKKGDYNENEHTR